MVCGLLLPCLRPGRRCCARKIFSAALRMWQEAALCIAGWLCPFLASCGQMMSSLSSCGSAGKPVVGAAPGACPKRRTDCSQLLGSVEEPCPKENSYGRSELHLHGANGCLK